MRFFTWILAASRRHAYSTERNGSQQSNTPERICALLCSLGWRERGTSFFVSGIIVGVSMMEGCNVMSIVQKNNPKINSEFKEALFEPSGFSLLFGGIVPATSCRRKPGRAAAP
jgi:hypothetical protein